MQQLFRQHTRRVTMALVPENLMMSMPQVRILLVEDDDVDAEAVERGLRRHQIDNPVCNARDGVEALSLLRAERVGPGTANPWVVLLDLKLAGMGGFALLDALRADPALKHTIVVVLTSSDAERDRTEAYRRGVVGYFVKANMAAGIGFLAKLLAQWPPVGNQ